MSRRLLAGGALGGAAYLAGLWLDLPWLRIPAKPVPVLCLALWVLGGPGGLYALLIAVGLLLSLLGDLLIEASFLAGLASFLLAHLVYIAAFTADSRAPGLPRALPFAAFGAGMYVFLRPRLAEMSLPVAVYVTAICAMMWRAAARVGRAGPAQLDEWSALAGAILFAVSDTLIALDRFRAPIPGVRYPIILLYWAGQVGIALSARAPAPASRVPAPHEAG